MKNLSKVEITRYLRIYLIMNLMSVKQKDMPYKEIFLNVKKC